MDREIYTDTDVRKVLVCAVIALAALLSTIPLYGMQQSVETTYVHEVSGDPVNMTETGRSEAIAFESLTDEQQSVVNSSLSGEYTIFNEKYVEVKRKHNVSELGPRPVLVHGTPMFLSIQFVEKRQEGAGVFGILIVIVVLVAIVNALRIANVLYKRWGG